MLRKLGFRLELAVVLLMWLLSMHSAAQEKRTDLLYTLTLQEKKIGVVLEFRGNKSGITTLNVPAFSPSGACSGHSFTIQSSSNSSVAAKQTNNRKIAKCTKTSEFYCKKFQIEHPPEAFLQVVYSLSDCMQNVVIDPDAELLLAGEALFLFPSLSTTKNLLVKIKLTNFKPKYAKVITANGISELPDIITNSPTHLLKSWFYLGTKDVTHTKLPMKYPNVNVVTIGFPKKSDNDTYDHNSLAEVIQKIAFTDQSAIDSITQTKNSNPQSVLVMQFAPMNGSKIKGLAQRNFYTIEVMNVPDNFLKNKLKQTISHEYMHQLFSQNLQVDFGPKAYTDEAYTPYLFWFAEGMNDYFATKLNLQSGVFTTKDYLGVVNAQITRYYNDLKDIQIILTSLGKQRAYEHFNIDNAATTSLLRRVGYLFSLNLDNMIQARTDGKRDIVDLLKYASSKCHGKERCTLSKKDFLDGYAKLGVKKSAVEGLDFYLTKHIENFAPIEFFKYTLNNKAVLTYKKSTVVDFGFDFQNTMWTGIVSGVKPESNAYKAGLRDGQRLKNGLANVGNKKPVNSTEIEQNQMKIQVRARDGSLKTFSYSLQTNGLVPQYVESTSNAF